ncbi:MAG: hypothetical protein A2X86_00910 [Bdellovibrionales bacterium GWA2_49_15]|nr:MAG: hypothetical protein A2X86_00910 [Bdellovibrionales bacterium GWA2_49_15]
MVSVFMGVDIGFLGGDCLGGGKEVSVQFQKVPCKIFFKKVRIIFAQLAHLREAFMKNYLM